MKFTDIVGQQHIKNHLIQSASKGRIPHAQLFIGNEGSGTLPMALAYAQYIICGNSSLNNNEGNAACNLKFNQFQHPDLHFVFPVATTDKVKTNPVSDLFLDEWLPFIKEHPYAHLNDWYQTIDIKNKQGNINVAEAANTLKKLALKSFEGGYKIVIIWMAECMNTEASNKLLKLLEEPPAQTVFLLISEDETGILPTILSRCQVLHFPPLTEFEIQNALVQHFEQDPSVAARIAKQAQGNYNKALKLIRDKETELPFEEWFITWVRAAFRANKNARVVSELVLWSDELAGIGRENQKLFLQYCMEMFRQALLVNYQVKPLVYMHLKSDSFKLENFAPFVNDKNITAIFKEISDAVYHIERNGNPKIIFTDLSIKLTRLIHRK